MWPLPNDVVVERPINTPWLIVNIEMLPESHGGVVMRMARFHDREVVKNLKFIRMGRKETRRAGAMFVGQWQQEAPNEDWPNVTFNLLALAEEGDAVAYLRAPPPPRRTSADETQTAWEIIGEDD